MSMSPSTKKLIKHCCIAIAAGTVTLTLGWILNSSVFKISSLVFFALFISVKIKSIVHLIKAQQKDQQAIREDAIQLASIVELQSDLAKSHLDHQFIMDLIINRAVP